MEKFGEYFKALRMSNGYTLREVEKLTDISNAYLSQLESEKVKQPSPIILSKLAELYEVSYDTLMEKVGYPVTKSITLPTQRENPLAARIGKITDNEEIELLDYLKFIRARKR
jgi:HTH-type transcriptional regulator, competence development regulator